MTLPRKLAATAVTILIAGTATAGAPDNPHAKRDLVHANQDVQNGLNGSSGFGQRIAYRAQNKSDSDPYRNFGDYLKSRTDGPNPDNDQGGGND